MCQDAPDPKLRKTYMELLRSVLFAATSTRPDISYAVSELAKFSANPGTDHWNGLIRILVYLKGTANYGLCYGNGTLTLYGVVDASYARCPDSRKSRYGGILMMNNAAIDWRSKMEVVVALSSMEAEYIGACELVRLANWMRGCLSEIGFTQQQATAISIDNQSAKIFAEE